MVVVTFFAFCLASCHVKNRFQRYIKYEQSSTNKIRLDGYYYHYLGNKIPSSDTFINCYFFYGNGKVLFAMGTNIKGILKYEEYLRGKLREIVKICPKIGLIF